MLVPRRSAGILAAIAALTLNSAIVSGQDFPNKPIRVFTSLPGGGTDFTARLIPPEPSASSLAQPAVVENRALPVLTDTVSKATPDGYTLMVHTDYLYFERLLRTAGSSPYDPEKDFSPITMVSTEPLLLVVHPSLPTRSV